MKNYVSATFIISKLKTFCKECWKAAAALHLNPSYSCLRFQYRVQVIRPFINEIIAKKLHRWGSKNLKSKIMCNTSSDSVGHFGHSNQKFQAILTFSANLVSIYKWYFLVIFTLFLQMLAKILEGKSFEYKFYGAKKGNCLTRFIWLPP